MTRGNFGSSGFRIFKVNGNNSYQRSWALKQTDIERIKKLVSKIRCDLLELYSIAHDINDRRLFDVIQIIESDSSELFRILDEIIYP